jgi:hypothetical protein
MEEKETGWRQGPKRDAKTPVRAVRQSPGVPYNQGYFPFSLSEDISMSFKLDRIHIWAGDVADEAGGVAAKLAHLAQADANLEYIYTRRSANKPGTGVLYVAPISGPVVVKAAREAGLRVEGDNAAGLAHRVTHQWAVEGLSLHGLMMSVLGNKFVGYVQFDSAADANRAAAILGDLGSITSAELQAKS